MRLKKEKAEMDQRLKQFYMKKIQKKRQNESIAQAVNMKAGE